MGYQVSANNGKLSFQIVKANGFLSKSVNTGFNFLVRTLLNPIFDLKSIDKAMHKLSNDSREGLHFFEKLRDAFELKTTTSQINIPQSGPIAFVQNHPLSGLEAIAAAAEISKVRKDLKLVVTTMLAPVPAMFEHAFLVNNTTSSLKAKLQNLKVVEQIKEHLKSGGAILILPVGEVSKKEKLSDEYAMEKKWRWTLAKMIQEYPEINVVPIFADGQPSHTFQFAKKISETFGTAFILRELAKGVRKNIELTFGSTIKGSDLALFKDPSQIMEYLRSTTYALKNSKPNAEKRAEQLIARELPQTAVFEDLNTNAATIFDFYPDKPEKGIKVFAARGSEIPTAMLEIARLRELSFRPIGEGSRKYRDIDQYDANYIQLVAWDKEKKRISGGYRLAKIDEHPNLYVEEFFDLNEVKKLGKVLELGRSFVHPDYQKRSLTLPALWKAIGRFLLQNPEYKYMMGPVSISNSYKESSKMLMVEFLKQNYMHEVRVKGAIEPKFHTYLKQKEVEAILKAHPTLDSLSDYIKQLEQDPKKGIPVLIPLYIKMGNRFMGFNYDPAFNSIDGMIITDFTRMPFEELKKYMDEADARRWLGLEAQ
ncbi:MAG: lysophospholipid acyltransferase family protein [Oligoflexia bacterium]|nr:lysophospholipid acyltransferase family protein [Oligoflexia bacterium]